MLHDKTHRSSADDAQTIGAKSSILERAVVEGETSAVTSAQSNGGRVDWSISDLTSIAWRKKWVVAGCVAISMLLGSLYLHFAAPIYDVHAQLLVQPQGLHIESAAESRPDKEFLATQAEIIGSPAVIEGAMPVVAQSIEIDQDHDPILTVLESLAVDPVSGTNVISVSYQCQDPSDGIRTVDGILRSYQQFLQDMNTDSRLESLRMLTRSEEKLRRELEDREAACLQLRKQSPFLGQQRDASLLQLESRAKALYEARDRRSDLQHRIETLTQSSAVATATGRAPHKLIAVAVHGPVDEVQTVSEARSSSEPLVRQAEFIGSAAPRNEDDAFDSDLSANVELAANPLYALISQELMEAQMLEKELSQSCGSNHPDMVAARAQVAARREQLRDLKERAPRALQLELTAAESRERQLLELYQQELEKAKANEDFLVKERLELDGIERLKTIHNSIVAQLNDWHLAEPGEEGGMGVRVVVLESPTVGAGPVWPKKSLLLSLSIAVGLLGGIGIVVVTNPNAVSDGQPQR